MHEIIGLCISCAHYRPLGLWKRIKGQTPDEPEGLCFACRDAAEKATTHGACDGLCSCRHHRYGAFDNETNLPTATGRENARKETP